MRRNAVFDKGRTDWRPEDDQLNDLRFNPGQGAYAGEYDPFDPSEYSDAYYGPADDYAQREFATGYSRDEVEPVPYEDRYAPPAGIAGRTPRARWHTDSAYGEARSYGELHRGERSWSDVGVSSVRPGESGITEQRPSFRGRGPKGYRRSDERIKEIVCDCLSEDPSIDASDITVDVKDGEVTLTGTVSDRRVKRLVEEVVDDALGGNAAIENRLNPALRRGGD